MPIGVNPGEQDHSFIAKDTDHTAKNPPNFDSSDLLPQLAIVAISKVTLLDPIKAGRRNHAHAQ